MTESVLGGSERTGLSASLSCASARMPFTSGGCVLAVLDAQGKPRPFHVLLLNPDLQLSTPEEGPRYWPS
jgi:hypothetical protein